MYYLYTIRSVVSLFACIGFKTVNVNHKKKYKYYDFFIYEIKYRIPVH